MTSNKLEKLLHLVGWFSWKYDARTCKPYRYKKVQHWKLHFVSPCIFVCSVSSLQQELPPCTGSYSIYAWGALLRKLA